MSVTSQQRTQTDIEQLVQAFGSSLTDVGSTSLDKVQGLSVMFNIQLPPDYAWFLQRFGALKVGSVKILGLAGSEASDLSVTNTTLLLRLSYSRIPLDILPVEELEDGQYAALVCPAKDGDSAGVVLLDLADPDDLPKITPLAPRFLDYLYNRLILQIESPRPDAADLEEVEHGLAVLQSHIQRFNKRFHYEHKEGGTLPANHDWRPYRFCIQDVLFGALVVQHDRKSNRLKVDVFLTADIPEYEPLAASQALAVFLISEAYKCGGSLEIQFTKEVQGGKVPHQLQELASSFSLSFADADHGLINSQEAKALYAALTGFSDPFSDRLSKMEADGLIKMVRACFVVHHGVWSREQVEMIVLGSEHPDRILSGATRPDNRHLYQHDLLHARAAVMTGMFDRALNMRNRSENNDVVLDLEDDFRALTFRFEGDSYVQEILCEEDLPIPWLAVDGVEHLIPAGMKFNVLIRARDSIDLNRHLSEDLKQATEFQRQTGFPTFLLIPYDFAELNESERQEWEKQCRAAHIGLLVCPEATINLDTEASQKLSQSWILRQ